MMVFRALLIDAYRQLSAAKLFWLTLGLSVLVVLVFGSIGFNAKGMSFLFGAFEFEDELVSENSPWVRGLYMGIFTSFLVTMWLSWIATILALISTCSIFPEFVRGGAIELTISKPIGRLKLFFMKYAVSLLFVVLQVFVFCVGIFLCVGLRMGEWNWMIFSAVPIVTVFFSYIFSVCTLVGMVTRSGITALLITGVFWMGLFSAQSAEAILNRITIQQQVDIDRFQEGIAKEEVILENLIAQSPDDFRIEKKTARIESFQSDIVDSQKFLDKIKKWHTPVGWILTGLPKTGQTIGLLDRWLSDPDGFDIGAIMAGDMDQFDEDMVEIDPTSRQARERETVRRMQEEYGSKSLWYVLGTSLIFEGFILGLASLYFCRKDF